jgi:hypothetical protein
MHRIALSLVATTGFAAATMVSIPVNITTGTGSSATQSTTHPAGPANNGIDGNLGNFTHTNPPEAGLANGWWEVNLSTDRTFNTLRIANRGDGCCQYRLQDLTVIVRDASNNVHFSQSGINAGNLLNGPSFIDVNLGSTLTNARFVRIERTPIPGQETTHDGATLSIGELLASNASNVLLPSATDLTHANIIAMSVSQSSLYQGTSFPAQNAVDSITNNGGNFTHTDTTDTSASWTVDFGEVMRLESIDIANRVGCCGERLRDVTVTIKDGNNNVVYTSPLLNPENILAGPTNLLLTFNGGVPVDGRYLTISRTPDPDHSGAPLQTSPDDSNVLSMSEVRVFGASIPEPSGIALIGMIAAACLGRRKRLA